MMKRIAVFAALIFSYALTGVALNAGVPASAPVVAIAAEVAD
ncbi:hypothetical protein [Aquabacter spiritensis]|uniref:Uncharacterized protein n=1 Tax=Aquabacter spiritensis TaxID=933073 RepID=A0A4R3M4I9_9HYPH|nr:hypothetical protein [Aquabacter spiritensis]TCT08160.1 hypothetical protein EDC64_101682 [Aquabacter spiritensis]